MNHKDYKLYIVGKGVESNVIEKLKDLAKKRGVAEAVVFTGPISPTEMPQMLYNAKILALARPDNLQAQNGFPTKFRGISCNWQPCSCYSCRRNSVVCQGRRKWFLSDANPNDFADRLSLLQIIMK